MMRPLTRTIWSGLIGLALLLSATLGMTGPVDPQTHPPGLTSSELQPPPSNGPTSETDEATSALSQKTEIPQKAKDLLQTIRDRQGVPPPGYVGGRAFQNRERRLPLGLYREYDVNPKRQGRPRDAERIVIEEKTGRAYYTADHYRTFVPFR
ncbi:MAG: ribonuclease domain-containing protein [Nitrospira sp.]|nr:ribonuclease domain-containing protein [Nitrospira sp.]